MPRIILTENDLPEEIRKVVVQERERLEEIKKDPKKMTLDERVNRIEKILKVEVPRGANHA